MPCCIWDLRSRAFEEKDIAEAIVRTVRPHIGDIDLTVPDWWKRAMRAIPFPPDLLWMGENIIRVTYCTDAPARQKQLQVLWPEIQLRYRPLPK